MPQSDNPQSEIHGKEVPGVPNPLLEQALIAPVAATSIIENEVEALMRGINARNKLYEERADILAEYERSWTIQDRFSAEIIRLEGLCNDLQSTIETWKEEMALLTPSDGQKKNINKMELDLAKYTRQIAVLKLFLAGEADVTDNLSSNLFDEQEIEYSAYNEESEETTPFDPSVNVAGDIGSLLEG